MNRSKRALLIVGSPKQERSTSYALLSYLEKYLNKHGIETETSFVLKLLHESDGIDRIIASINNSDFVILAAPLYVDLLPAPVILMMEKIAGKRTSTSEHQPMFIAIINSGFPEAHQNRLAIEFCKMFAKKVGFLWGGGLPFGGGAAINGESLEQAGSRARFARPAMELLAKSLADGMGVPDKAVELISKPIIPKFLYARVANRSWVSQAKEYGMHKQLDARPYLE